MPRVSVLTSVIFLWLAAAQPASAQVKFLLDLTLRDAADSSRTIQWGVHPLATFGLDTLLFDADTVTEIEQPPLPPLGAFDLRWTNPSGHIELGLGTHIDVRHLSTTSQIDTYRVKFQTSGGGYPVVASWPRNLVADYYGCPVRLRMSGVGGTTEIDMRLQDSLVITDNTISVVILIAACPHGPNVIGGTLYDDTNGNGDRDAGEPGLVGWTVHLGGAGTGSAATDASGDYEFTGLRGGVYTVAADVPSGWIRTEPGSSSYTDTVGGGLVAPNRDFGMFRTGVLRGFAFNDANGDGGYGAGEVKLPGWSIILGGAASETTQTGSDGYYEFTGLTAGHYTVREGQDPNYVQLRPSYPGYYPVTVTSGLLDSTLTFGNKSANVFVGQSGGNWSDPANWSGGHPPTSDEVVVITVPIVVDSLPEDTIVAIRIAPGASVTYPNDDTLVVLSSFQIDSGAVLTFLGAGSKPSAALSIAQPEIVCFGSWINNGTFEAGNSLITFAGDSAKVVGPSEFFDLQITGKNTSSGGDIFADKSSGGGGSNIYVTGTFTGGETFDLQPEDTLFILNPSPAAIEGTGLITNGTIVRAIAQGATDPYRFESPESYIQFDGSGVYPSLLSMTVFPAHANPYPYLLWKTVPSNSLPASKAVAALGVSAFSWWTFGPSGGGAFGLPAAARQYVIHATGGSGYTGDLGLRYEESELSGGTDESTLRLLKGPYFVDSVAGRWNMLSLPVAVGSAEKDGIFPASSSNAFAYEGGAYAIHGLLETGLGYWLRFPAPAAVQIEGLGILAMHDSLRPGWNLIGGLSIPLEASALVTEPPGILAGLVYGYDGSYYPAATLNPMEAYWVKASGAGGLTLAAAPAAKRPGNLRAEFEAFGKLTVTDSRGNVQLLYFGGPTGQEAERYELPPPPPDGVFSARFASQLLVARGDAVTGDRIVITDAVYPVTIAWVSKPGLRAELLVGKTHLPLEGDGRVSVATPDAELSVVSFGTGSAPLPAEYRLRQNYPNPFNPATVLSYELPNNAYVTIVVYNMLGQSIAVLQEELVAAGIHELRWSGSDLPSGVYFCRLTAVDPSGGGLVHSAMLKMILMK